MLALGVDVYTIYFALCFLVAIYVTEGNATQTGSVVGRVNASDPDGDTVTFISLDKTESSYPEFGIDTVTGDVTYEGTELLDYDSDTT